MHLEKHIFPISNNHDNINVYVYKSSLHWEIDFLFTGNNTNQHINKNTNDQYVIDHFIKSFCQNMNICQNTVKIIVFLNIHRVSFQNQKMLLRIMESICENVKFIFLCDYYQKIDNTIKSRCVSVRIPIYFKVDKFFHIGFDKTTHKFKIKKYIMNSMTPHTDIIDNHIDNISSNVWTTNKMVSRQNVITQIFNNILQLKSNMQTLPTSKFIESFNKIVEDIDNYLISGNYLCDFFKEFILFVNEDGNINQKIISHIAELEYIYTKVDFQMYILESFLSFFLLN